MSLKTLLKRLLSSVLFVTLAGAFFLSPSAAHGQVRPLLRVSVENNPGHVQTEAVREFAEKLEQALGADFDVQFYDSGTLYRDRHVIAALAEGKVEIAVPGTWQLDRFEPSVAVFLLPAFLGRSASTVNQISDGPLGRMVSERLEEALPVVVLGRWLNLGPAHLYLRQDTTGSHAELSGMTVRVAGGLANEMRIAALGATPVSIPWAELPAQLETGAVDAALTTHETVRSGRLWEYGITSVIEDFQYFPQYVPLVRSSFWRRLSIEQRRVIRSIWEQTVDPQRVAAAAAQQEARAELQAHGVRVRRPPAQAFEQTKALLVRQQPEFAARLDIPDEVLRLLEEEMR